MKLFSTILTILLFIFVTSAISQDVSDPLTYQGMGQFTSIGVRTRAMGGAVVAVGNDLSAAFTNPAVLTKLKGLQFQVSGRYMTDSYDQTQRWNPNRFYADMSLMFENKLGDIKDPDVILNPTDRIHRPFDTLYPAWDRSLSASRPSMISVAMPFSLMNIPLAVGLSYSEIINLNHYYQNNNAINPVLGQYRPQPIPLVAQGDTLPVDWYQYMRRREGSIQGITPSISISPFDDLHIGFSVSVLNGESDDDTYIKGRGRMRLLYNAFLLDSANHSISTTGTSKYIGTLTTIGLMWNQDYFSLGVSLKPPATITRNWGKESLIDTSGVQQTVYSSGSDDLKLPWLYTLGVAIHPNDKWNLGIDYAIQNFSEATYTFDQGSSISPWINSAVLRIGAEYHFKKWLDLRFGAREEATTFAPTGEGLIGEPEHGSAYTAGLGLKFNNVTVNLAGEYGIMRYNDLWQSNVNTNTISSFTGMIEFGYQLGQ